MPVPTLISSLSQTAASNSPPGSESPTLTDDYFRAHAGFLAMLRDFKQFSTEATLASAATTDIGAANSYAVAITGTTTITSLGVDYQGPRFVRFAGALTLTHNATTLILPGNANITTAAGDTMVVVPSGTPAAGWRVVSYQHAQPYGFGPMFSAYANVNQAIIGSTFTKVLLQTEEFDTAGAFDNATNYRFQPTVAGYYRINGAGTLSVVASGVYVTVYKNGARFKDGASGSLSGSTVSALVFLNGSTDYVELYIWHGSAGTLTLLGNANSTYFQGSLVRPA